MQAQKVAGCLAQRVADTNRPQAIKSFRRIDPGCFDLTWKKDDGVGYNTAVCWATSFFESLKLNLNKVTWELELPQNTEAGVVEPAGGVPQMDSVAPVGPGGGAPLGGVAASCGVPPHSTAAGEDNRDSQAEKPAVIPSKRPRLLKKTPSQAGDVARQPDDAAGWGCSAPQRGESLDAPQGIEAFPGCYS